MILDTNGLPLLDTIHHCDALDLLRALPDGCIDAIITDPPYAEISRDYGRLSEDDWMILMQAVTLEIKRILKPSGSALIIIQPNSETVGTMRAWVWNYLSWCCQKWNVIQDAYWWNISQPPTVHSQRKNGLMRPSVKTLVWLGSPDCYRNQDEILWRPSDETLARSKTNMALQKKPSGYTMREARMVNTAIERGGSTPFNILPVPNTDSRDSAGSSGHGAGTAYDVIDYWMRYISKPKDLVLDSFMGSGTTAIVARDNERHYIGCDISEEYVTLANRRLAMPYTPLMFVE